MNDAPGPSPAPVSERDWLVLLSQSEVVGPISGADLRVCIDGGQIPGSARLFRFEPAGLSDDAGAALRAEVARLGEALREAEARVRRLEADLQAKDLEFEGERQQMSADMSKLRADGLRKDARIETLAKESKSLADAETARAAAESALQEERLRSAKLAAEAAGADEARRSAETLRRQGDALRAARDAARRRAGELAGRLGDISRTLAELAADAERDSSAGSGDAEEVLAEETPPSRPGPLVRGKPTLAVKAEIVTPVVETGAPATVAVSSGDKAAPASGRLASLEAQARQELAMLRERGAAGPRWGRRKG